MAKPSAQALIEQIKNLLLDIKFAPAEGGSEMDEVRTVYGQFFVKHGEHLVALLSTQAADVQMWRDAYYGSSPAIDPAAREAREQQTLEAVHADFHRRIQMMLTPKLNTPVLADVLIVIGHANEAHKAAIGRLAPHSPVIKEEDNAGS